MLPISYGILCVLLSVKYASSISCYKCNSDYDPHCGLEFVPYTLGVVNCSLLPVKDHLPVETSVPILCRKTIMKIAEMTRVIRECGYMNTTSLEADTAKDINGKQRCISKSGTPYTSSTYCECYTDKCNDATAFTIAKMLISVMLIMHFISNK